MPAIAMPVDLHYFIGPGPIKASNFFPLLPLFLRKTNIFSFSSSSFQIDQCLDVYVQNGISIDAFETNVHTPFCVYEGIPSCRDNWTP